KITDRRRKSASWRRKDAKRKAKSLRIPVDYSELSTFPFIPIFFGFSRSQPNDLLSTLNLYTQKQRWKILLLLAAMFIGAASLWYTNRLVKSLSEEEKKKVELWAEATRKLGDISDPNVDLNFLANVISNNTTLPVRLTDEKGEMISYRTLDPLKVLEPKYVQQERRTMLSQHEP